MAQADLHRRLRKAAADTLRAVKFEGIAAARVHELAVLDEKNLSLPCVAVCLPEDAREEAEAFTTEHDRVVFPLEVVLLDRPDGRSRPGTADRYAAWRATLLEAFLSRRLTTVSENMGLEVLPGVVLDPSRRGYQLVVSVLGLRCECVIPRA